jgi:hypothetical protein
MTKDQIIAELREALKPLADEPTKDEGERADIPMMCNLSDTGMDAIILRARKAMELSSIEVPSIH